MALGHRQDIAQAAAGQLGAQLRVLAVDLVACRPRGGRPGVQGTADHLLGQRGLGRECRATRHPGVLAPGRVSCPGLRQVQGPVDERRPGRDGIGQVDRDLGVLGPPGRAGVLPLHTH